jgi:hypothetical protein
MLEMECPQSDETGQSGQTGNSRVPDVQREQLGETSQNVSIVIGNLCLGQVQILQFLQLSERLQLGDRRAGQIQRPDLGEKDERAEVADAAYAVKIEDSETRQGFQGTQISQSPRVVGRNAEFLEIGETRYMHEISIIRAADAQSTQICGNISKDSGEMTIKKFEIDTMEERKQSDRLGRQFVSVPVAKFQSCLLPGVGDSPEHDRELLEELVMRCRLDYVLSVSSTQLKEGFATEIQG